MHLGSTLLRSDCMPTALASLVKRAASAWILHRFVAYQSGVVVDYNLLDVHAIYRSRKVHVKCVTFICMPTIYLLSRYFRWAKYRAALTALSEICMAEENRHSSIYAKKLLDDQMELTREAFFLVLLDVVTAICSIPPLVSFYRTRRVIANFREGFQTYSPGSEGNFMMHANALAELFGLVKDVIVYLCFFFVSIPLLLFKKKLTSGHAGPVTAVKLMHSELYTAGADGTVRVWDSTSCKCMHTFENHTDTATAIDVVDEHLFSCSLDGTLVKFSLKKAAVVTRVHAACATDGLHSMLVIPIEGKQGQVTVFTGSGGKSCTISQWNLFQDMAAVQKVFAGHTQAVSMLQVVQTSEILVSGSSDCTVRIWNIASGLCVHQYKIEDALTGPLATFLSTKQFPVQALVRDSTQRSMFGTILPCYKSSNLSIPMSFDNLRQEPEFESRKITGNGVETETAATESSIRHLPILEAFEMSLEKNSDFRIQRRPSLFERSTRGVARLSVSLSSKLPPVPLGYQAPVNMSALSVDESFIYAATSRGDVLLYDVDPGALVYKIKDQPTDAILCSKLVGDDLYLGLADGLIFLYDVYDGSLLLTYEGHTGLAKCLDVVDQLLFSAGQHGEVFIWSTEHGIILQQLQGHNADVNCILFSTLTGEHIDPNSRTCTKIHAHTCAHPTHQHTRARTRACTHTHTHAVRACIPFTCTSLRKQPYLQPVLFCTCPCHACPRPGYRG